MTDTPPPKDGYADGFPKPRRKRRRLGIDYEYRHGKMIIYEVPPKEHEHDPELWSAEGTVFVFDADHAASFPVPQWVNPRGHYVYMVWGENAVDDNADEYDVLYIGMSSKILYRIAQHSLDSPWWQYAEHIDIYQYATRDAALEVEAWAIRNYGPLYNIHKRYVGEPVPLKRALARSAAVADRLAAQDAEKS